MYSIIDNKNDFIILNKYPGISFHNENEKKGLFNKLKDDFKDQNFFPVHRLDKITSGLLIVAKNKHTAAVISKQFNDKKIEKYYIALSDKKPKKRKGIISGDLVRSRRSSWKLTRNKENPSITKFISKKMDSKLYFFLIKPLTGKTHQIRVALKSLGSPVIGDPVYYKKSINDYDRAYLHSYYLKFKLKDYDFRYICPPESGKLYEEEHFISFLEQYKEPFNVLMF